MFLTSATCDLFEKRWHNSVITAVAISRGACRHRLHFAISRKIHKFSRSFRRLSCIAASRILLYTNTHHQMGQQEEPVVDTCSPSNLDGPCMDPQHASNSWITELRHKCGKKGQCVLFLCYSLWYFVLSYSICYINCH